MADDAVQEVVVTATRSPVSATRTLADVTVLQTGADGEGLLRQWPAVSAGVDKHHGYAFQWFGLSGLIATLYVWFQLVRRFLRPRSTAP